MKIQLLDRAKKKKFIEGVSCFGVKKINELLIRTGSERIRAFSGSLSKEEIMDLWKIIPVEGIGLYIGKDKMNRNGVREVRLSVDGVNLLKEQITENILDLDEEQERLWFLGKNFDLNEEQEKEFGGKKIFVVVRSKVSGDFIGTGKIGGEGNTLFGFLPKERRRRG